MSLCRRPYIDRRKEFSEEERDRLTKIDNEIWEKAKDSKLFFKVYPLVGKPGYQIKNNASINSVYNFVSEINKKYDKKVVKLSKTTEFKKEILSVNVMPLSRETIRESYIQNLQAKNQQRIDARRSGIDYSEDYLFQESDTVDQDLGLEQRLFSESKDTTSLEILNKIANSDHNLASLAAHLIPYAKYVNAKISLVENIKPSSIAKNPNGAYNPNTGDIVIKKTAGFTASRAEATILHEIIHSLTYYELRKGTEENAYFTELFNHAELYLGTLNLYGLSNKDEFMTALFTDADFVKQLQNVPPLNKKKYTNLFQEVFDKILKLLRITKSSPFYEEAFSTATNIIENFRQREIEKTIQKEEYAKEYEEYLKSSAYEESLYSEGQTNIKPGVEELFDSNPELANSVYEAMGFEKLYKTDRELDTSYLSNVIRNLKLNSKQSSFNDSDVKETVFHIAKTKVNNFSNNKIGSNTNAPDTILGHFFSENYSAIADMRETKDDLLLINGQSILGNEIHEVSINLKNPFILNSFITSLPSYLEIDENLSLKEQYKQAKDKLIKEGYDGIVYGLSFDGVDLTHGFVVFDSKNIKVESIKNDKEEIEKNRPSDYNKTTQINYNVTTEQKQQALQQYSQYLDTIFPDSKVKDIVYHSGSIDKNSKFDRNKIGSYSYHDLFYFSNSKFFTKINTKLDLVKYYFKGEVFKDDKIKIENANSIDDIYNIFLKSSAFEKSTQKEIKIKNAKSFLERADEEYEKDKGKIKGGWYKGTYESGQLIAAVVNVKTPYSNEHIKDSSLSKLNENKEEGQGPTSTYILDKQFDSYLVDKDVLFAYNLGIKNPEQIHILGSKQDVEGFKKFVGESTQTVESYRAQEQAELSQKIPNIENYKVDGKVVKSLITDENDLKIYNEIYNKYDALITPLLETSEESTNTVKNKIAINKLFKSLPILDTIGTQEQYLRHFNSVYSDTSVPIVVYRAVKHEGSELKDKSFFTDDPEYAIKYGDILKPYKLNILSPYISTKVGIHRASIGSMLEDPMVDGIIGKESLNNVSMRAVTIELQEAQEEGRYLSTEGAIRRLAGPLTDTNSFVTTNVNQVYELGTEIDVDNFKEFVRNDLGTKELNKKSVSLYSKIFDISEDEINEHLKNCG